MITAHGNRTHDHRVLVVDDEPSVGKAIGRILDTQKIKSIYVPSGEAGIEAITGSDQQFSLIICDQRMAGMQGTQFLAHAKEITPESIRFLTTGYSEMDTIINAVNKGAIQHYISKPWDTEDLVKKIQAGIARYEQYLESEQLSGLAKKQNAKLYDLNCELMEAATQHDNERKDLDSQIQALETELKEKTAQKPQGPSQVMANLQKFLEDRKASGKSDAQKLSNELYAQTLHRLYDTFNDLALRNGIEMPDPAQLLHRPQS